MGIIIFKLALVIINILCVFYAYKHKEYKSAIFSAFVVGILLLSFLTSF